MTRIEFARALRSDTEKPCNCCQTVLVTYAKECGLTQQQARDLGAYFMGGMRIGSTCGAVTGGLMVLGLMQAGDAAAKQFLQQFRKNHEATNCPELLKLDRERGNANPRAHCDSMIFDAVGLVAELYDRTTESCKTAVLPQRLT